MEEVWKNIQDCEGLYEISSFGRIRDLKGNVKSTYKNNKGYECFTYSKNGKTQHFLVHRLVALAFIPNENNYKQVNHIDCNKANNSAVNLEWCNQIYNYKEGMRNFLYSKNDEHYFSKLKNSDIPIIKDLFILGFTRATIAKIFGIHPSSVEAIEKGISYRELDVDFNIEKTKYKDKPNIIIPSYIRQYFKDNTVLNTLIAKGKVSV